MLTASVAVVSVVGSARTVPLLLCWFGGSSLLTFILVLRSGARIGTNRPFTLPVLPHTQGPFYVLDSWDFTSVTHIQSERFFFPLFLLTEKWTRISHVPQERMNKVRFVYFPAVNENVQSSPSC